MTFCNRRGFLCAAYGTGGLLGISAASYFLERIKPENSATSLVRKNSAHVFRKTTRALGSDVSITAIHENRVAAESAIEKAFDELRLVESLMSIYQFDSQLSRLNRDKWLVNPHPYLLEILKIAAEMSRRSNGAFDITVQPLWKAYAAAKLKGALPEAKEIDVARSRINWRNVVVSAKRIELLDEKTEITLNGIAQGYAADKARKALCDAGVFNAMIDTGEIGTLGHQAEGDAWTVGVQHPRQHDSYVSLAKLAGRSLATSGDYATLFSPDFRHHHIFDPTTARSPTQLSSVSIAAGSTTDADALSTAVFVLGPKEGIRLVESFPHADALLVFKNGRIVATDQFPISV